MALVATIVAQPNPASRNQVVMGMVSIQNAGSLPEVILSVTGSITGPGVVTQSQIAQPALPYTLSAGQQVSFMFLQASCSIAGPYTITAGGNAASGAFSAPSFPFTVGTNYQIDVKLDFGAKGDGVTDDTAAIQAAINALPAIAEPDSLGGSLYFPDGNYKAPNLTINNSARFFGSGNAVISGNAGGGNGLFIGNATPPDLHVRIERLRFALTNYSNVINASVRRIEVEDCSFSFLTAPAIYCNGTYTDSIIRGNLFDGGTANIAVQVDTPSNHLRIENNGFNGIRNGAGTSYAITVRGSAGVAIRGNDFEYCDNDVKLVSLGGGSDNANNTVIFNNWFEGTGNSFAGGNQVFVDNTAFGYDGLVVLGNTMSSSIATTGIVLGVAGGAGIISNALIRGNSYSGGSGVRTPSASSKYVGLDTGSYSFGTGAPDNANGADGDFYFRSDGGAGTTIYQKRTGSWTGIV